jgi:hypothetical protein
MSKNNQITPKKARTMPKNQQTKKKSLQTRKGAEISAGLAQIALVLLAVVLSFLLGYHLRGQECKSKLRADLSRFDKIGEILLNQEEYVAPDFK